MLLIYALTSIGTDVNTTMTKPQRLTEQPASDKSHIIITLLWRPQKL